LQVGAEEQVINEPHALKGRVLLAEDGEDNQTLIATHLRKVGLEVVIAGDGKQAVDQVKAHKFDLVLMDMQMPEMDGYSATRMLRQLGHTLPIVALTANAMAEDRVRCLNAGCTEYLSKPISRTQLLRTVARFINAAGGAMPESPQAPAAPVLVPVESTVDMTGGGLQSEFVNEPTVRRLLEKFIDRLPERVSTIAGLIEREDLAALKQAVHQLKGAGGGYGFPRITEAAGAAEEIIRTEADLDSIRREVESLMDVVRTVQGYDRSREQVAAA
jgi:CheY-like chemotaxis protein